MATITVDDTTGAVAELNRRPEIVAGPVANDPDITGELFSVLVAVGDVAYHVEDLEASVKHAGWPARSGPRSGPWLLRR